MERRRKYIEVQQLRRCHYDDRRGLLGKYIGEMYTSMTCINVHF